MKGIKKSKNRLYFLLKSPWPTNLISGIDSQTKIEKPAAWKYSTSERLLLSFNEFTFTEFKHITKPNSKSARTQFSVFQELPLKRNKAKPFKSCQ